MKIEISNLQNFPQHIDTVVNWLYSEWGNNNYAFWRSWVINSLNAKNANDIPQTYIMFANSEVVGTYSLWRCDLQSRQDLFPWFGGLYVKTSWRGRNLSFLLFDHAKNVLVSMGYKVAYCFTEKEPKLYQSWGWQVIGQAPNENDMLVTLCKYPLL